VAADQSRLLKHVQVVREQVGRHPDQRRQLGGGHIAAVERVSDQQPRRVGQRRVDGRPPHQVTALLSIH
jgi:hypothetical protein